jgi:pSer/pThr/pTyr-binding forkhead associated (FHA) protein
VIKGKAGRETYDLDLDRVYLGRLEEVLDGAGRVKRRNDVAFLEEGDLSQTVSREHARIAWDAESRAFWLRDEGSASGTLLLRDGRSIEVSRHDRRGVKLASGDEVYLGRASVRIELVG